MVVRLLRSSCQPSVTCSFNTSEWAVSAGERWSFTLFRSTTSYGPAKQFGSWTELNSVYRATQSGLAGSLPPENKALFKRLFSVYSLFNPLERVWLLTDLPAQEHSSTVQCKALLHPREHSPECKKSAGRSHAPAEDRQTFPNDLFLHHPEPFGSLNASMAPIREASHRNNTTTQDRLSCFMFFAESTVASFTLFFPRRHNAIIWYIVMAWGNPRGMVLTLF